MKPTTLRHPVPARLFDDSVQAIPSFALDEDFLIDIAVRVLAETLGDAAYYLRVVGPDELEGVKYFHRDLARHLVTSRLIGTRTDVELVDSYRTVLETLEPLVTSGCGLGRVRNESAPAYEQFAAAIHIRAAAVAPVIVGGVAIGVLGLLRENTNVVQADEVCELMGLANSLGERLASSSERRDPCSIVAVPA